MFLRAKNNQEFKILTDSEVTHTKKDFGNYYFSAIHFVFPKSSYFLVQTKITHGDREDMFLESGNVCFLQLLLCRDVNNLYPFLISWLKFKGKSPVSILQLFLWYFPKVFQLVWSFLHNILIILKARPTAQYPFI